MATQGKGKKLSAQLKMFSRLKKTTYILYGSLEALTLFDDSVDVLLKSDCFDFDLREYSQYKNTDEIVCDIFEIEGFRKINEKEFQVLHQNLCEKIKKQILDPKHQRWLKKLALIESKEKNN